MYLCTPDPGINIACGWGLINIEIRPEYHIMHCKE